MSPRQETALRHLIIACASNQTQYEPSRHFGLDAHLVFHLMISQFSNSQTRLSSPSSLVSPQTCGLPTTIHNFGFNVAGGLMITTTTRWSFYNRWFLTMDSTRNWTVFHPFIKCLEPLPNLHTVEMGWVGCSTSRDLLVRGRNGCNNMPWHKRFT